jgi:serine/threonine protein kinase
MGDKLGSGAFAEVRACTKQSALKEQGQLAVKIITLASKSSPGTTSVAKCQQTATEIQLWKSSGQHNNIVRLDEVFFGREYCYVVMEKCDHTLFQYLDFLPDPTESCVGNLFAQALSAIAQVHAAKVVHRDIKPENLLVGGSDGTTVKLCDFGLSAMLPKQGKLTGVVGTAPYMCPEMLANRTYDEKADVWSLGVLSYSLLFGHFPYRPKHRKSEAMKKAIAKGIEPTFEAAVQADMEPIWDHDKMRSDDAVGFVRSLMQRAPDSRPSAKEALKMTYMAAVMNQSHAVGVDLPSLKPMLTSIQIEYFGHRCTPEGEETVVAEVAEATLDMMSFARQFPENQRLLARQRSAPINCSPLVPEKLTEAHEGKFKYGRAGSDVMEQFTSISTAAISDSNSQDTIGSVATSLSDSKQSTVMRSIKELPRKMTL